LYSVTANITTEKFCSKYGKLKDFNTKNVISGEGRKRQPPSKPKSQDESKVHLLMILVLLCTAVMHLSFSSSTNYTIDVVHSFLSYTMIHVSFTTTASHMHKF